MITYNRHEVNIGCYVTCIEPKTDTERTLVLGSHDAMAYSLDMDSSVLEPKKIKALDKMFSTFIRPIVKKWGTAQVKY